MQKSGKPDQEYRHVEAVLNGAEGRPRRFQLGIRLLESQSKPADLLAESQLQNPGGRRRRAHSVTPAAEQGISKHVDGAECPQ